MNRFDEEWPEESFAIFKEVAGRIGTTIVNFQRFSTPYPEVA
jgi:hypothetical protein